MEAIQFTEEQRRWSETTLELGTIAKSLMGNQEEVTAGNFIGTQLVENPNFDQNIPGDSSPVLGNELVQNGDFSELGSDLVINGEFISNSDWNLGSGDWIISNGFVVANNSNNALHTNSAVATSINLTYKVTFDMSDVTSGYVKVGLSGTNQTQFSNNKRHTLYIVSSGNKYLYFTPYGFTGKITNITVKQVDPNDYWAKTGNVTITDKATLVVTGGAMASISSNTANLVNGSTYLITFSANRLSGSNSLAFTDSSNDNITGTPLITTSSDNHTYTFTAQQTITGFGLKRHTGSGNYSWAVDNISVKEIIAVDIDLWTTIVPNLESSVKFETGKATIDYDADGLQGLCGIKQDGLSSGNNFVIVIDYKMISGKAKILGIASSEVILDSTTRTKVTFNVKNTSSNTLAIYRRTPTDSMKMEIYSINVYESNNVVKNGTGSDSVGLSGDWAASNLNIESDTINGGIILTNAGGGTQGSISQTVTTIIGVEYRLYAKVDFGDATSFFVWNSVNGYPTAIPTDGISFIDFTATSTTTSIRVYINSTSGEFVNVTDINCSPTTPFNLGSNWDIQAGTGLVANGYGNNNAVESFTAVADQTYRVEYKISSYTQGSVRVQIGGTNGTANASVGTFVENLIATNTGDIDIQNVQVGGLNFIGVIDYIKIQSGEQSDTLDMTDQDPKAIWITGGGALKVTDMSGTTSTIDNLPSDKFIDWLRIKRIWLTGTTATGIIGIY